MKLRTKLLLGVAILFVLMIIVMYVLPTYFVRQDVYKAADEIHELLVEEHQELVRSQKIWIENVIGHLEQNLDAILMMLYEEQPFSTNLAFKPGSSDIKVWNSLAQIVGYDPAIGFIQAHSPKENKTALINPHSTQFYPVVSLHKEEKYVVLGLNHPPGTEKEDYTFIGVPLPKDLQKERGYIHYALINPKKAQVELEKVHKELVQLPPGVIDKILGDIEMMSFKDIEEKHSPAYYWAIKINMIRLLAPLIVEGFSLGGESFMVPEGLARINHAGEGLAILSQEALGIKPLFNDQLYYENHLPRDPNLPLAQGSVLIPDEKHGHAFLGNTLQVDSTFITLASPLGELIKQLALASDKTIIVRVGENFWMGFDGQGKKLSNERLNTIIKTGFADQNQGMIAIDKEDYFYAQIISLMDGDLLLYDLHRMGGEKTIINTLLSLENKLTDRISIQLSIISLITMILVLIFVGRIGFGIIYPITKLAQATEDVVAGKYELIKLPEVGKRRDEVAILTRSFGDMVKGLQERERIRGVLDKVVSKDVADEILRTQIHLGGEDRIVTMLFGDIRGFTHLTENLSPQETIQMLNGCMTKVSRVIESEGGVIDKYVGDEVMALFGAPTSHPDHALRSVSAGMLIIETLKKWNQKREAAGEPAIEMGIGINTGLVVVGNMGAEDRLNYTVLGASVNIAARLSELAKPNQLIISESTLGEPNIKESFYVEPLAPIVLKGFSEPINIFEVTGFKWEE